MRVQRWKGEGDFGSRRLRVHYVTSIVLLCRRQKSHVWMMAAPPPPKQAEGCRCSELPSTACNTSKHIHTQKKDCVSDIKNFYIYRFVCVLEIEWERETYCAQSLDFGLVHVRKLNTSQTRPIVWEYLMFWVLTFLFGVVQKEGRYSQEVSHIGP